LCAVDWQIMCGVPMGHLLGLKVLMAGYSTLD